MNKISIENVKIKSDLQYDILFESNNYNTLNIETKQFLKECYDLGVKNTIELYQQNPNLFESIDEGYFDRLKAGVARAGQGLKNVTGIGSPTTDSKDAGVYSLYNNFVKKLQKSNFQFNQGVSQEPKPNQQSDKEKEKQSKEITAKINNQVDNLVTSTNKQTLIPVDKASEIINKSTTINSSWKQKLSDVIKKYPISTNLIVAGLTMLAGSAAAASSFGLSGPATGIITYSILKALVNKAEGKSASDDLGLNMFQGGIFGGYGSDYMSYLFKPFFSNAKIFEAITPDIKKIYDEFLKDLSKYFKIQPNPDMEGYDPMNVINFMKSQGSRFKFLLDFLKNNAFIEDDQKPEEKSDKEKPEEKPGEEKPGSTPPSGLTKELQSKLDVIITPDFLSGLVIQFPEKIRFSKLENNTSTLLSAKSLTKIALKISKDKVLSMLIKCQINNTTLRFQTSFKPEDLNQKLKNLFEITFDSKSSVDIFKRKLVNTLAIEFSKNPVLSGGKSSKDLSAIILSYLNPKIDDPIRKMVRSIYLTIQEVSYLIEKDDIVYIGVSNKGIKFIKEKSSSDTEKTEKKPEEKPVEKPEEKPEEKPAEKPFIKPYEYEPGELEENKLFESINRKNKNIFKLR
jgi:hypothetical protein